MEFDWWEEEEWEIGSGELGVCSLLRVAAPGGEKHLLTMQNRKHEKLRIEGSNQFSFEGSNILYPLIKVKEGAKQDRREKENYEKEVFYRRVNWSCFF